MQRRASSQRSLLGRLWNGGEKTQRSDCNRTQKRRLLVESLEGRRLLSADFTLELLHFADQEAGAAAVQDAPRLSGVLNALRAEDLGSDGVADNTLTLSSGDAFIPGLFFDASEAVYGSGGIADIQIQNELGVQAIALGNHEFDFGTATLSDLIDGSAPGSVLGSDFSGTDFPYLSTNLNFSLDANMSPLEVAGGQTPQSNAVSSSTIIDVNGESIAVVGATTPTLDIISSPGDVGILPADFDPSPTDAQLDALAAEIQSEVDSLLTANPGIDKVIVLAHMQQLDIELSLAERLVDVDIIVAGGSNTRLFDSNDRARDGDSDQGEYPQFVTNAGATQTAVVNTDGSYKYVGRLVIGFDASGNIMPETYDAVVSGAFATDQQGVDDLSASGLIDPEIQTIADEIQAQIIATEGNVFGVADVFLNGNRSGIDTSDDPDGVRTQQTNLGDLTADANLAIAQAADPTVVVSIKNGGGIRASIGRTFVPPGGSEAVRLPNEAIFDDDGNVIKPEGGISQNDIQTTLAFNNGLSLLTLTRAELVDVLEHGVGAIPGVSGRFPQISGVRFSYDPSAAAGSRIQNAVIVDSFGTVLSTLVEDGVIVGDANEEFRIVTLNFLAGGGDGYPFPQGGGANRVDLYDDQDEQFTGDATFAPNGTEQDALAEYLNDNYLSTPYGIEDQGRFRDARIQNLGFREDTVFPSSGTLVVSNELDAGAGSFRSAVQAASDYPAVRAIRFQNSLNEVPLESTIEFYGEQRLRIDGRDVSIAPAAVDAAFDLFSSTEGADLQVRNMAFEDSLASGISVRVPGDATGKVRLAFDHVDLVNNGLYGLHVDDQSENSAAGIDFTFRRSTVVGNGFREGFDDYDGIRIDEGGDGGVRVRVSRSEFLDNAADGFEIDERGNGNVTAQIDRTNFLRNGSQPQNLDDLEDGFDIDESGDGSIYARLSRVEASDNLDEGIDLDEEGNGNVSIVFNNVTANRNGDEGIKVSEDADAEPPGEDELPANLNASGSIIAHLYRVTANENGDDGIELEEFGAGSVIANLFFVDALGNGSDGFQASEGSEDYPDSVADEQNAGNLHVRVLRSRFEDNGGAGIKVEQVGPGVGRLILLGTRFDNNTDGPFEAVGVDVFGFWS